MHCSPQTFADTLHSGEELLRGRLNRKPLDLAHAFLPSGLGQRSGEVSKEPFAGAFRVNCVYEHTLAATGFASAGAADSARPGAEAGWAGGSDR